MAGIVGPNGAGKTTLIDTVCGLVRPSSGTVRVLGEDLATAGAGLRARIGVLPQETALYDEVTARQNLKFAAALYAVPRADARIAEVLGLVGLQHKTNDVVRGLETRRNQARWPNHQVCSSGRLTGLARGLEKALREAYRGAKPIPSAEFISRQECRGDRVVEAIGRETGRHARRMLPTTGAFTSSLLQSCALDSP